MQLPSSVEKFWKMDKRISFSAGSYFLAAVMLLLFPLRWVLGALLAAGFHELFHYLALRLCGVQIWGLEVGPGGALIKTEPMDRFREFLCALAGPAGSFILVLTYRWFPVVAVCAGMQGFFNLLPLGSQDGGRMLRCVAGARIAAIVEKSILIALILWGIYGFFFLKLGFGILIMVALLIHRAVGRKIPCKDGLLGVQ